MFQRYFRGDGSLNAKKIAVSLTTRRRLLVCALVGMSAVLFFAVVANSVTPITLAKGASLKDIEWCFTFADGWSDCGTATKNDWMIHNMLVHVSCSATYDTEGYPDKQHPIKALGEPAVTSYTIKHHETVNGVRTVKKQCGASLPPPPPPPPTPPQCPIPNASNRTLISFNPTQFLVSNGTQAQATQGPLNIALAAGSYTVTLASYDPHSTQTNASQPREQWHAILKNTAGTVIATTSPLADLPDTQDVLTQVVDTSLLVPQPIATITAFHNAYPDASSPNSIRPLCVAFDVYTPPSSPPPSTLTLIKTVVNDNGGTASAFNFTLFVNTVPVITDIPTTLIPGTYHVSEVNLAGYTASPWEGNCAPDGTVTISAGQNATCTITNNDNPPPPPPPPPTLAVTLQAIPSSGTAPLTDVDLIADVTGTAVGTINYTFYCERDDAGVNITTPWDAKFDTVNDDPKTAADACDYSQSGTYRAKVIAERQGLSAEARTTITVTPQPPLPLTLICTIGSQVASIGENRITNADGGTGSYTWSAPGGSPDSGVGTYFTTSYGSAGYKIITVTSGSQTAQCALSVTAPPSPPPPPTLFPQLLIEKTASTTTVNPNEQVRYTVVVRNIGSGAATNVLLSDALPTDLSYVGFAQTTRTRDWSMGTLAAGASITVLYDVLVSAAAAPGVHTNVATVRAANHVTITDIADVRVPQVLGETALPSLAIEKSASVSFTNPGGTVAYTITVTNRGKATAEQVIVTDALPPGFVPINLPPATLTWNVGNLAVGATWIQDFDVRVAENIQPGVYRNVAAARATNHDHIEDNADTEIRAGQVLGISTIPATGTTRETIIRFAALVITLLTLFTAGVVMVQRRFDKSPEDLLQTLVSRARKE